MSILTGLSGNEIFCLHLKGFAPGELVLGNSVGSLGFLGGIGAGFKGFVGGEITQVTEMISEGRHLAQRRLIAEAQRLNAQGVTGVTSELRHMQGNIEFLSVGSCVHDRQSAPPSQPFASSSNGQELFTLMDCGYVPNGFVIGNVAYSVGVGRGLLGALKTLARGEIKEYSDIFNATRHLALARITAEARRLGANAVLGIETRVMPFRGVHEMLMIGTAASHPGLPPSATNAPITSDLTCEEMWNLAAVGYRPLKLLLGTAVYSLGFVGGVSAFFKSISRGEISELTTLIYEAREHAIGLLKREADHIGADGVVGIKTYIHEYGSLIEFMAIGTAITHASGTKPQTPTLPVQAVIRDRDTWIASDDIFAGAITTTSSAG